MNKIKWFFLFLTTLGLLVSGLGQTPAAASGPNPVVIMETSMGRIIIMLYPKEAPVTVENFLRYVDAGFYDGTVFHRVVRMEKKEVADPRKDQSVNIVQGGGFVYPLREKRPLWGPIINEDGRALQNRQGTIAMARTSDPDSATSQFFFNVFDNTGLDPMVIKKKTWVQEKDDDNSVLRHGYCAFGKVLRGMDVVEKIHQVKTGRMGPYQDVPLEPVYLKRAYRAK